MSDRRLEGESRRGKDSEPTHDAEELAGTDGESLLLGGGKVLLLSNVGHEGDDLVALVDEPGEDARGVFGGHGRFGRARENEC